MTSFHYRGWKEADIYADCDERVRQVIAKRAEGKTLAQIGVEVGRSKNRVHQIIQKAERQRKRQQRGTAGKFPAPGNS